VDNENDRGIARSLRSSRRPCPLVLFLGKHGELIPRLPMMNIAYGAVAILAIVTALGTYERSALIGLVILGATCSSVRGGKPSTACSPG
jgi:hypothetical protein